jgi:hypothetical protein
MPLAPAARARPRPDARPRAPLRATATTHSSEPVGRARARHRPIDLPCSRAIDLPCSRAAACDHAAAGARKRNGKRGREEQA